MSIHSRTRTAVIASLALGSVALTGCSSDNGNSGTTAAEPVSGGELRFAQADFPTCLDIAQSPYVPTPQQLVVDNLVSQDTTSGEIKPWLAESWKIENNGTRYVFTLRTDVSFSNGEKFTAASVKNTFDNAIALGKEGHSPQASAYLLGYTGTDVIDDHTAAVNFSSAKGGFLEAASEKPLGIISDQSIAAGWQDRCKNGVIGTGPFVIDSVATGQSIHLTKRPDYQWGPPTAQHTGPAYLDSVTISVIAEDSVRTGSLLSDDIDIARSVGAASLAQVQNSPHARIETKPSAGVPPYLSLNLAKPVFQDTAVRRALQIGIDRQDIVDTVYTEYEPAATSILSTPVPGYLDLSDKLGYNPDKAASLLDSAGWKPGPDGVREKNGQRLSLDVQFTSDSDKQLSELLQQQLKKLGIELQLRQVTSAQSTANQQSGDWNIVYGNLTRPDPDVLLTVFHPDFSSRTPAGAHPELNKLLEQIAAEPDSAKRLELTAQAQNTIIDEAWAIPIKEQVQVVGVSDKVHGFRFDAAWWPVLYDVWLS